MKNQNTVYKVNRRKFIKSGALSTAGLMLGVNVSFASKTGQMTNEAKAIFSPSVYLSIDSSGEITITAHRSEMGNAIRTTLPLIIADELEAEWDKVKIVQAEGDRKYGNQNTDGSFSVRMFYMPMRRVGATARYLLEQAAAKTWNVPTHECKALKHKVYHTTGKSLDFGKLAATAAKLPMPKAEEVKLKDKKDFKYITKKTSIYDLRDIVEGKAKYGHDIEIPNARVVVVKRPPVPGGKVKTFDSSAALKVKGVEKVFKIDSPPAPTGFNPLGGVVVVAKNTWAALKGREALKVTWDLGKNGDYNTDEFKKYLQKTTQNDKGLVRREGGNVATGLKSADQTLKLDYFIPHYTHTPMETPCAVADYKEGKLEVWAPAQVPQWARGALAQALKLKGGDVKVNVTLLGGGFGRKGKPDFIVEAGLASKECGYPVKLLWTREDDVQHDFYHACCAQHFEIGLNKQKQVTGWLQRAAYPSIGGTSNPNARQPAPFEVAQGMVDLPYNIENLCQETNPAQAKTRIGWVRSVININNAFSIGSALDELAHNRGVDPVKNLLELLGDDRQIDFASKVKQFWNYNENPGNYPFKTARLRNVIETVAKNSNWGKKLPNGYGRGIAAHRSFLTYVACVVEVFVKDGEVKIPNVYYVVDCGVAVNPDRIKAQFEGGAVFGTSLALFSEITMKKGAVQQSNFHDLKMTRMNQGPQNISVQIVESDEKPTGVGEPPVPPFAPALCNAIFAATGKRHRSLPVKL